MMLKLRHSLKPLGKLRVVRSLLSCPLGKVFLEAPFPGAELDDNATLVARGIHTACVHNENRVDRAGQRCHGIYITSFLIVTRPSLPFPSLKSIFAPPYSQLRPSLDGMYSTKSLQTSLNPSRPSEHPPVRGENMSKRLGGIIGCRDKTSSWHLNGSPYGA